MDDIGKWVVSGTIGLGCALGWVAAGVGPTGCDSGGGMASPADGVAVVSDALASKGGAPPMPRPLGHAGLGRTGFRGHAHNGRHVVSAHGGGRSCDNGGAGTGGEGGGPNAGGGVDGAGGRAGAGGGSGSSTLACLGRLPTGAAITGSVSTPVGGTYTYAAANLIAPTVDPITSADGVLQGLHVSASPGVSSDPASTFSGLGLFFDAPPCVSATAYTGVRFTIAGDIGTCRLSFVAVPSEDNAVANGPVGTCTAATCLSPSFGPLAIGSTIVHFAEMSGGQPLATLDPAALNDIGWQLDVPTDGSPACTANFTITDVSFVDDRPRLACTGSPPVSPVIADFSSAFPTVPGSFLLPTGGTFTYASALLTPPSLSLVPTAGTPGGQALAISVASGAPPAGVDAAWAGFGLYFNMCTDASAYSGIRFTIAGDVGTCPLQFSAQFSEDDDPASDPSFGSCTAANCFPPWFQSVAAGTTSVRFSDLTGGAPLSTVDAARLTAIHWQFMPPTGASAASCAANFTLADVSFIP